MVSGEKGVIRRGISHVENRVRIVIYRTRVFPPLSIRSRVCVGAGKHGELLLLSRTGVLGSVRDLRAAVSPGSIGRAGGAGSNAGRGSGTIGAVGAADRCSAFGRAVDSWQRPTRGQRITVFLRVVFRPVPIHGQTADRPLRRRLLEPHGAGCDRFG